MTDRAPELDQTDLDETARAYLDAFDGDVEEFAVGPLDVLPVHLHSAAVAPGALAGGSGLGYGATAQEARVGGLGEMTEVVLAARAVRSAERIDGSFAELVRRHGVGRVQDPRTLCLEAGSSYDDDRPLQWLPMVRLADGEQVLVPAELVASSPADLPGALPPGGRLVLPITNGQGAHLDEAGAVAHALLELVQRDGNSVRHRALDRGVVVDLDGQTDPDALELLGHLDDVGVDVQVKLADEAFGIAGVVAVGCSRDHSEPVPLMATACGEAAALDAESAVRKALFEFVSARSRKALMHGPLDVVRRATPPGYLDAWLAAHPPAPDEDRDREVVAMERWTRLGTAELVELVADPVLSQRSSVRLADLPTWTGPDPLAELRRRLADAGCDVLVATRAAGAVTAVKVVVPGLEVETMSYGRLGERGVGRLLEDDTGLVAVGADPGGWSRVHLTAAAQERLGGPAWFDSHGADRRVGALYPLYREPGRHVVARRAEARGGRVSRS